MAENLVCSICLELFNDPVTTPCGHNFCKICLNTCWDHNQVWRCPNCNKTFNQRPDLKTNTALRDVVDEHKKKIEVLCDICDEEKLKAVKSCLVCQSSYCETHREPHLRVTGLQKHKLIDPVKNLQDYICPKHERPLELFCRDDQTCVCVICTVTDHKYHNTVPLRESELQEMMEDRQRGAEQHDDVIKDLEQEITDLKMRNTELEMTAENQRAAETQDKGLIKDLKKEITELKMRNIELEMKIEMQKASEKQNEDVIKNLNREITELKKRNIELQEMMEEEQRATETQNEDVIKDLMEEITELKMRNIDLEMKIEMQKASEKQNEDVIKDLMEEITELKRINIELQEMMEEEQRATEKQDKGLIKDLKNEISQITWRNNQLEMTVENWITAEKQYENAVRVRDQEIVDLKKRNTELMMVKQKQITAENAVRVRDQEIVDLKKRNTELMMVKQKQITAENAVRDRDQELTELKMVNQKHITAERQYENAVRVRDQEIIDLKKRNTELMMVKQKQITAENAVRVRDQEIVDLKKRNTELMMVKQKQITAENAIRDRDQELTELKMVNQKHITAERQYENAVRVRDQEIIDLKKRNTELMMVKQKQITAENAVRDRDQELTELKMVNQKHITAERQYENAVRVRDQEIIDLKKRNTELMMVKQKQITAENAVRVRDQEIVDLKKRNTEQQQKISNTENNLRLLQEKHQNDLSRLQKSSSEGCCGFWCLACWVVILLPFLTIGVIETANKTEQRAAVLRRMQQYAVDVTLDPDTAHCNLILSDDKKQVRHENTALNLPNYSTRFNQYFNVLGKEGFSSGRFYFEVQVTGKTVWIIGVAREYVIRKGDDKLAPVNGYWTVYKNNNDYVAHAGPDVSLTLSVKPQKVGVFVDYKLGLVSFYDVGSGYHIYSYTAQYFTGKLFPVFNPCGNSEGRNSKPLIITPVKHMTHDISSVINIKIAEMCKCMKESVLY